MKRPGSVLNTMETNRTYSVTESNGKQYFTCESSYNLLAKLEAKEIKSYELMSYEEFITL